MLEDWCLKMETFLDDSDRSKWEGPEAGPATEVEYWKRRLAKLHGVTEQLKTRECKTVIAILATATKQVSFEQNQRRDPPSPCPFSFPSQSLSLCLKIFALVEGLRGMTPVNTRPIKKKVDSSLLALSPTAAWTRCASTRCCASGGRSTRVSPRRSTRPRTTSSFSSRSTGPQKETLLAHFDFS